MSRARSARATSSSVSISVSISVPMPSASPPSPIDSDADDPGRAGKIVYRCGDVLIHYPSDRRWPGRQQPAARAGRHHLRRRHREHLSAQGAAHRRARRADLRDRIGRPRPRPGPAGPCRRRRRRGVPAGRTPPGSARHARRTGTASPAPSTPGGRPPWQIGRHPRPAARASSAAQITATTSTRRPRQNRGNSTCERPQPAA